MMSGIQRNGRCLAMAGLLLLALTLGSRPALAQSGTDVPQDLAGAVIVDKPDAQLPLDARFVDENGNPVTLGHYFNQGKPVLLTLVYLRCPMLCTLVVNGMVDALRKIKYSPGEDFTMLTVSIDPLETSGLAKSKRQNYLDLYGRPGADAGWHFLTGTEGQIRQLADAVGFGYKWNEEQQMYAHQAGLFLVTPQGRLSRTLYGVDFNPVTLKGSLLEAGHGTIGTPVDKVYFSCLHFDAAQGKYTTSMLQLTRIISGLVLMVFCLTLAGYFAYEARQRRRLAEAQALDEDDEDAAATAGWHANLPKGTR